jgi:hypothetical protein
MEKKLYVEYRLYVNPDANQETLKELATEFQEYIHDSWNDESHPQVFDVTDVTFELVVEIKN